MQFLKKIFLCFIAVWLSCLTSEAQDSLGYNTPVLPHITQYNIHTIESPFTVSARRESFKKYLMDKTVKETFSGPLNQYTEYKFEDACLSATQFLIKNEYTKRGFDKMFSQYFTLDNSARLALLTAVYGIYPKEYTAEIKEILPYERDAKLFAVAALYAFNNDSTNNYAPVILTQMRKQFAQSDTDVILNELTKYLYYHQQQTASKTPPLKELFNYQQLWKQKTIYSFQRWDRNFSGICIVQYEDGSFARDSAGRLMTFRQLARAGSNLPYFITNGNTPQGVYRIAGERVSIDKLIGPTPTLQSVIPFQNDSVFYRDISYDPFATPLDNYKRLLPPSWQHYAPMQQSFFAGKAGRRYIVVHGSTLDPSFFADRVFYPLSPTDGCLSTAESWNSESGKLAKSEQLSLVNTYLRTPAKMGMLFVINLDDQPRNISASEIELLIKQYEDMQKDN